MLALPHGDGPVVPVLAQRADQVIADVFTSIANELAGLVEVATGIQEPQV